MLIVIEYLEYALPIGLVLGTVAAGGVLRCVDPKLWPKLPLVLRRLFLTRASKKAGSKAYSQHELWIAFYAFWFVVAAGLLASELDVTLEHRVVIFVSFTLTLAASFLASLFGVRRWVLNKWYPRVLLENDQSPRISNTTDSTG